MTDTEIQPDLSTAPGWVVLDPDGNVVASGGVTIAQADARVAEMIGDSADDNGGQ